MVSGLLLAVASAPAGQAAMRADLVGQSDPALHVIPFPGTPDASPGSEIIFSSLSQSDMRSVVVRGSRSGRHTGRLAGLPDGAGTAFIPGHRFAPGESVTVRARLSSPAAGTASGDPRATSLRFSFGVGVSAVVPAVTASGSIAAASGVTASAHVPGALTFRSLPHLRPPKVRVAGKGDPGSGDVLLTPRHAAGFARGRGFQPGVMIVNRQGRLVWFRHVPGTAANLEVQRYQGQPVLTWWQRAAGHKEDVIMDRSYRVLKVLHAGDGYASHLDLHEFQITPQGTAFVDIYVPEHADLTSVGGSSDGTVWDCIVQELDIRTGRVLWEWHMLGHVPVSASYYAAPTGSEPYGAYHLNSIQQLPNGNILISARHTWAVYEVSRSTGQIVWTLGGKYSNFRLGRGAGFSWQHDARLHPGGILSLFDDASDGPSQQEFQSSAKELRLNVAARTATLVHRYDHSPPLLSPSQGNAQLLANHDLFVGWGSQPAFSEYSPGGGQIFSGRFALGGQSYRAYRSPWSAQPATPPAVAIAPRPGGSLTVYASWNGATQVSAWRVLGGSRPLSPVRTRKAKGFETALTFTSQPRYLAVEALSSNGRVLGSSTAHPDPSHLSIFASRDFVSATDGRGAIPVGCIATHLCQLAAKLSSGQTVLARSPAVHVAPRGAALLPFRLSSVGRRELARSTGRGLAVQVSVHGSAGTVVTRKLALIPYSTSGPRPQRHLSQSATVQIVEPTGFVSSAGRGLILSACYAPSSCRLRGTISSGGTRIGRIAAQWLGSDELSRLSLRLNPTGQSLLANAPGNQLAAQITLTDGSATASGQVALVRYGRPASGPKTPAAAAVASSSGTLHVIPFPGTPDASPRSEIIFSSLSPSDLRSVAVQGSRSGHHTGRLTGLPDRAGTAFTPDHRFAPSESVTVQARLSSPAAGTTSGDPGSTSLRFSFGVRRAPSASAHLAATSAHPASAGGRPRRTRARARVSGTRIPAQHFRSEPHLRPVALSVTSNQDRRSGDMFVTPRPLRSEVFQRGPMILDSQGRLVWFLHLRGMASNLEVQHYQGRPVLTWWQGTLSKSNGREVIMNRSYKVVKVLRPAGGYSADAHEFQITPQGTALIDVYVPAPANLTSVGGPSNGTVADCVIQELDIRTGRLLWEWHAWGHIPLSASYARFRGPSNYDYFHLNSIQQLPNGNLLISARNTWAVYEISRSTGQIVWTLGGKHSSFRMGRGTRFEWQHDARLQRRGNLLTLFDDAGLPQEEPESSGKTLRVDFGRRSVSLVHRYDHRPPLLAGATGGMQLLPNGDAMVDWGSASQFSEYSRTGRQIFNGRFPLGVFSYRGFRFPWTGHPGTRPSLAVAPRAGGSLTVFASWNGATRVASWRVLGGPRSGSMSRLATARRTGFETSLTVASEPRYLAVQALDAQGHVLGTSQRRRDPSHLAIFGSRAFVPGQTRYAKLPVGCLTPHRCAVTTTVRSGQAVLAHTKPEHVGAHRGGLAYFRLSGTGEQKLLHAPGHRLEAEVTVRASSGGRATKRITLIAYSTSGQGPPTGITQSRTVQIVDPVGFASSAGQGGILSACYGTAPCRLHGTITSDGVEIGTVPSQGLGSEELGWVSFQLNQAGRLLLAHASGNQLAARISLGNGKDTARGRIALVRYG